MLKFLEAPDRKLRRCIPGKSVVMHKREIRPHFSLYRTIERTSFHETACSEHVYWLGLAAWYLTMSAASEPTSPKKTLQKATNLDLSTTGGVSYILTPCLGDVTISIKFRKNFRTLRKVVEPRNKVEIWKVSWSLFFLPTWIPLQPSRTKKPMN